MLIDEKISEIIIGCAVEVHKQLGPGLLESAYKQCLAYELSKKNLKFELEKDLPVKYKEVFINCGYRIDILVENKIIIELKSVSSLNEIFEAQLLTYMKLANIKIGLLINFNEIKLINGLKRFVL